MVGLKSMDFASKWRVDFIMGRRSFLDGLRVAVEEGDMLPYYELFALKSIIKKVALRMLEELKEEFESEKAITEAT